MGGFKPIDFAAVGRACGAKGYSITEPDRVEATLRQALADEGPTIFRREPDPEPPRPLSRGKRVRHPRYGYGVILSEEGSGDETRLTVYFDRAGKKKFIARYADLTPA